MIEAIKAAKLPHDKYQTVTIINSNDAIWGTSGFVKSSAEDSKKSSPGPPWCWMPRAWPAMPGILRRKVRPSYCWIKRGKVLFAKDGQLDATEITKVMGLIQSHL